MTIFLKNFLSNFKKIYFLIKIIRNRLIYSKIFYFIDENDNNNLKSYYLFKKNNLEKFLNKTGFFFITNKKISLKKREDLFKKLFIKIKQTNSELIYDGNCKYHTEIISTGCLQKYSINYNVENYPYKFFYFYKNNNFKLEYIGTNHRIYNFNGSFLIPGGGRL